MLIGVTSEEILKVRERENCSLQEAQRIVKKKKILKEIDKIESIEDVKTILKAIFKAII